MRKWSKLSAQGKRRRVLHVVRDFFVRTLWGDYQRGGIRGVYHWVRCHVWNRYHIIDLRRHGDGEYRWGWIDRDWAMYLACFHLLCDFVENEDPEVGTRTLDSYRPDWVKNDSEWLGVEQVQAQIDDDAEIRALYDWWKRGRAEDHKRYEASDWSYKVREELDAKDDEMLMRLMKVRRASLDLNPNTNLPVQLAQ